MFNKILPMTGVEPRTSGIESNRSTNWATTTSIVKLNPVEQWLWLSYSVTRKNRQMSLKAYLYGYFAIC